MSGIFKPRPRERQAAVEIESAYAAFSGAALNDSTFISAVDGVARHCGKLKAQSADKRLEALLNDAPNPYMGGYDLLYKTAASYLATNNGFILLRRESAEVTGLFPLAPSSVEFKADGAGALLLRCSFPDGRQAAFPYADIAHVRRHFFAHDLLGSGIAPLFPLLETAEALNRGVAASVKNGTALRGVLKFTSLMNPAQIKAEKDSFVRDYFNPGNSAGLAAVDQRFDFQPTNAPPYQIPAEQIGAVNAQICDWLGVNARIVSGDYSEDAFSAFYESAVEPFALQLSQELSRKCGADVAFTSERLEFSSAATKIKLLHEAAPLGLMTLNEARKLLALPPVEDGDTRLQSLNFINSAGADKYQLESEGKPQHGTAQLSDTGE